MIVIAVQFLKSGVIKASGDGVNPNLHRNSGNLTGYWTIDQGTVSNGVVTVSPTSSNDRRIYQMPASGPWTWQANTKYTVSIDARSSNGAKLIFAPYGGNTSSSSAISVTSDWARYSYTFTTGSSPTTGSMTYSVSQTSGVTLELRRPKLELGSVATPWIPHVSDSEYNAYMSGFFEEGITPPRIANAGYAEATEFVEF